MMNLDIGTLGREIIHSLSLLGQGFARVARGGISNASWPVCNHAEEKVAKEYPWRNDQPKGLESERAKNRAWEKIETTGLKAVLVERLEKWVGRKRW